MSDEEAAGLGALRRMTQVLLTICTSCAHKFHSKAALRSCTHKFERRLPLDFQLANKLKIEKHQKNSEKSCVGGAKLRPVFHRGAFI